MRLNNVGMLPKGMALHTGTRKRAIRAKMHNRGCDAVRQGDLESD